MHTYTLRQRHWQAFHFCSCACRRSFDSATRVALRFRHKLGHGENKTLARAPGYRSNVYRSITLRGRVFFWWVKLCCYQFPFVVVFLCTKRNRRSNVGCWAGCVCTSCAKSLIAWSRLFCRMHIDYFQYQFRVKRLNKECHFVLEDVWNLSFHQTQRYILIVLLLTIEKCYSFCIQHKRLRYNWVL